MGTTLQTRLLDQYNAIASQEALQWQGLDAGSWIPCWERTVDHNPHKVAVVEIDGLSYSYQALDHLADRYAQWALSIPNTHIGVRLPNGAYFLAAVIGVLKANRIAVLLPYFDPPALSEKTAQSSQLDWVISDLCLSSLRCQFPEIIAQFPWPGRVTAPNTTRVSTALVIFTSGTSGRRKAALFSHRRLIGAGIAWSLRTRLAKDDRCYIALPLFHGNGLAVAFSSCVQMGATAVIRQRFSPGALLEDLRHYKCTAMVYVGELWRLMDQQPIEKEDSDNPLRVIFGNGLSAHLWGKTTARFGISHVVEHYGATEMPAGALTNWTNIPGYCGFIPPGHPDEEDVLIIDEAGHRADSGRSGELLLRVPGNHYLGYLDPSLNQECVKRVAGKPGLWWRSADRLSRNAQGFYSFIERVGESFRWKGENIPTADVEEAIYETGLVEEAVLVGVEIPHRNERAGLASILPKDPDFEVLGFLEALRLRVAPQAIPCFLIIQQTNRALTPTLKIHRHTLEAEGCFSAHYVLDAGQYKLFSDTLKKGLLEGGTAPDFRPQTKKNGFLTAAWVTRLWNGPHGLPSEADVRRWAGLAKSASKHIFAAVDAAASAQFGEILDAFGIHQVCVPCWESVSVPLNALFHQAAQSGQHYIFIQSVDIQATLNDVQFLLSHMQEKTLVVGARIIEAHGSSSGLMPLTGRSSPWNTCAVWNAKNLLLTGFLSVSDGLRYALSTGMEETAVIALHQQLFRDGAQAKLVSVGHALCATEYKGRTTADFEARLDSKDSKAAFQLGLLGLKGIVQVEHEGE